jgi:hypothetical protein
MNGVHEVMIRVTGAAGPCPLPECATRPCPEADAILGYLRAKNCASQECVRDLVAMVGGTSDEETFALLDAFAATLTPEQVRVVATHPHVEHIQANDRPPPPPPVAP